jgi:hypothetical protein
MGEWCYRHYEYAGIGSSGRKDGKRIGEASLTIGYGFTACCTNKGVVLFTQADDNIVRQIKGDQVTTIAGNGKGKSVDGPCGQASFEYPFGIAHCPITSKIFVIDGNSSLIRVISPDGMVSTVEDRHRVVTTSPTIYSISQPQTQPRNPSKPSKSSSQSSDTSSAVPSSDLWVLDSVQPLGGSTRFFWRLLNLDTQQVITIMDLHHIQCSLVTPSGDALVQKSIEEPSGSSLACWWQVEPAANCVFDPSWEASESSEVNDIDVVPTDKPFIPTMNHWTGYIHDGVINQRALEFATVSPGPSPTNEDLAIVIADVSSLPIWYKPSALRGPTLTNLLDLELTPSRLLPIEAYHSSLNLKIRLPNMVSTIWSVSKENLASTFGSFPMQHPEWLDFGARSLISNPISHFSSLKPTHDNATMLLQCCLLYIELGIDGTAPERALEILLYRMSAPMLKAWFICISKLAPKINRQILMIFIGHLLGQDDEIMQGCDEPGKMLIDEWIVEGRQERDMTTETPCLDINGGFGACRISNHIEKLGEATKWIRPTPAIPVGRFRLSIQSQSLVLEVSEAVLYSQWVYFRRMINSGLSESQDRVCEFPSDMPPKLLLAIVQAIHGLSTFDLSTFDAGFAISNGEQFGLVQVSNKDVACSPFEALIEACRHLHAQ